MAFPAPRQIPFSHSQQQRPVRPCHRFDAPAPPPFCNRLGGRSRTSQQSGAFSHQHISDVASSLWFSRSSDKRMTASMLSIRGRGMVHAVPDGNDGADSPNSGNTQDANRAEGRPQARRSGEASLGDDLASSSTKQGTASDVPPVEQGVPMEGDDLASSSTQLGTASDATTVIEGIPMERDDLANARNSDSLSSEIIRAEEVQAESTLNPSTDNSAEPWGANQPSSSGSDRSTVSSAGSSTSASSGSAAFDPWATPKPSSSITGTPGEADEKVVVDGLEYDSLEVVRLPLTFNPMKDFKSVLELAILSQERDDKAKLIQDKLKLQTELKVKELQEQGKVVPSKAEVLLDELGERMDAVKKGKLFSKEVTLAKVKKLREEKEANWEKIYVTGELPIQAYATFALAGFSVATFALQWLPLFPALLQSLLSWPPTKLMAFLLISPYTNFGMACRLNLAGLAGGDYSSFLSSVFVHSGLLSMVVCVDGLLEAGSFIEDAYGPIMLILHVLFCALGAGIAQSYTSEITSSTVTAIGGPGLAVGMYAALAVHALRSGLNPIITTRGTICCVLALLVGFYQPLVGPWCILGGCIGGAVAAVGGAGLILWLMFNILYTSVRVVSFVLRWIIRIPQIVLGVLGIIAASVWRGVVSLVAGVRNGG